MIEVLDCYDNGCPKLLKWFRENGTEVQSYVRYKEVNKCDDSELSYSVWGTVFNLEGDEIKTFNERFYLKQPALEFYDRIKEKYPISRINFGECILKKEYF
ncbi:MAG: hypothetical protein H6587_09855 [Flavobacteriales bacterium]|nr:hypothetical protein [Flavobacteriales bacterium]